MLSANDRLSCLTTLQHIVTYPVSRGRFVNVVPFYTDYSQEDTPFMGSYIGSATNEELLQVYDGWEPEVMTLLRVSLVPSFVGRMLTMDAVRPNSIALVCPHHEAVRHMGGRGSHAPRRRCTSSSLLETIFLC